MNRCETLYNAAPAPPQISKYVPSSLGVSEITRNHSSHALLHRVSAVSFEGLQLRQRNMKNSPDIDIDITVASFVDLPLPCHRHTQRIT